MPPDFDPALLLNFWFGDTRADPDAIDARNAFWFGADPERDRQLTERYSGAVEAAARGSWGGLENDSAGRLALILLLDQLPRNIHRGTARAFATDPTALDLCVSGHDRGMDAALCPIERVFFWMPLQHVEDLEFQDLGVRLFDSLAAEDPDHAATWNTFANYAHLHCDIIARFGRFPHRNEVLGRDTTDEERAWLADSGMRFGQ